jgi:hypothetical protein
MIGPFSPPTGILWGRRNAYMRIRYRALRRVTWGSTWVDQTNAYETEKKGVIVTGLARGRPSPPSSEKVAAKEIIRRIGIDDYGFAPYRKNHWSALALFTSSD